MSESPILRTGVLFKKGSGTGPFGRKNWKPRYFVLTPSRLQYFTFEDGECKGEVSFQGCDESVLEVMPADSMKTGNSASTIWRVAINAPTRRLLVAAGTEMEMNDWVDKLVLAFRINAGQPPMERASMPTASGAFRVAVHSNPSFRDFRNFSVPRRSMNQRHSIGSNVQASTGQEQDLLQVQAEHLQHQRLCDERRGRDETDETRREHLRQEQQLEAEQEAQMYRQVAAQQERERDERAARKQQEAAARETDEAALAAAKALQRSEKLKKLAQMEHKLQKHKEMQRQEAVKLQRTREEEAARLQHEQEQEGIQNKARTDELMVQEALEPQPSKDLLEMQRRQKREKHAHQRAERQKAIKVHLEQEKDAEELAFRLSQLMHSPLSVDNGSDDSDDEPERSSLPRRSGGGLKEEGAAHLSTPQASAASPRSSLVGDVKRKMIRKQQIEHHRRREAALVQQQHAQDAGWRQQRVELERHRVRNEVLHVREAPREMEVAPREIEVVRRAPVKKPAPATAPMESREF